MFADFPPNPNLPPSPLKFWDALLPIALDLNACFKGHCLIWEIHDHGIEYYGLNVSGARAEYGPY
jgi:hypothetical protein